jgi:L-malate glycosyltransferase
MIGQLATGGAEKQIALLACGLRDRGIDTSVWTLFYGGRWESVLQREGIPVMRMGMNGLWHPRSVLPGAVSIGRTIRAMRRDPPDVLHAFLFAAYVVAAPVARIAGIPVLVAGRRSLANFKDGRPALWAAEWLATRATDMLIANAEAVASDVKRREKVAEEKIRVVYNGLPEGAFASVRPATIQTPHPVVLCVANLRPYKGHRHLLDAMATLQNRGRPCTLVLAGEGSERQALEDQASRQAVDVRFLGECTELRPFLARADVVAHPSDQEGMSNAVMEAMAAGRPVVATAVGGTPELLRGRGMLVPPAQPGALADAIQQVLDDRLLASRLGESAREWSLAHLRADVMVDRHIQIYSELLGR